MCNVRKIWLVAFPKKRRHPLSLPPHFYNCRFHSIQSCNSSICHSLKPAAVLRYVVTGNMFEGVWGVCDTLHRVGCAAGKTWVGQDDKRDSKFDAISGWPTEQVMTPGRGWFDWAIYIVCRWHVAEQRGRGYEWRVI